MKKCRLKESERSQLLLEPNTPAAVAHFAECPPCAHASVVQSGIWLALDAWTAPEVSSAFNRNLFAKIDAEMSAPWYERWAAALRPVFAQPLLAAAVVALVAVSGFVLDHPSSAANPVQASTQVSTTDVEQVEKTLEDLEMLRQFDAVADDKENASKSM